MAGTAVPILGTVPLGGGCQAGNMTALAGLSRSETIGLGVFSVPVYDLFSKAGRG